jgi:molybdopterin converting factor small subunit
MQILKMAETEDKNAAAGKKQRYPADLREENKKIDQELDAKRKRAAEILGPQYNKFESAVANNDEAALGAIVESLSNIQLSEEDSKILSDLSGYETALLQHSFVNVARENMARYLTIEAHRQGSYDNISVVVVWLDQGIHLPAMFSELSEGLADES